MKPTEYRSPDGYHMHMCFLCGLIWEHADEFGDAPEPVATETHKCPRGCGVAEYWRYPIFDPGPPESAVFKMGDCGLVHVNGGGHDLRRYLSGRGWDRALTPDHTPGQAVLVLR